MESEKSPQHHSKNNQTINLRTDFTEFDVSLDKYSGTWNVQNFTELLNKPKVRKKFQIFFYFSNFFKISNFRIYF
jgi:hypothetical protein